MASSPSPATGAVHRLPLDRIVPNPLQPRRHFDEAALAELAASVKEHGVLQPVIVSRSNGHYQLVVGERRWRAAQSAGLEDIPVVVRELTETERLEVALIENIQREDLSPLEEAAAFQFLMREHGMKQDEVAARVGKSRSAVANTVRLLHLPPQIQHDVQSGELSAGHARAMLSLEDTALQLKVWARVKKLHLSVRQTETLVKRLAEPVHPKKERRLSADWVELEETLQRHFSAQVKVKPRGKSTGRIEIHYASPDELERLLDAMMPRRAWMRAEEVL